MDKITYITGYTNYVAPFLISDVLLLGALICVCFLDGDIGLPKGSDTMKENIYYFLKLINLFVFQGVKTIFSNISILVFIVMMFVCGSMFGFVETFLFVYLKVFVYFIISSFDWGFITGRSECSNIPPWLDYYHWCPGVHSISLLL